MLLLLLGWAHAGTVPELGRFAPADAVVTEEASAIEPVTGPAPASSYPFVDAPRYKPPVAYRVGRVLTGVGVAGLAVGILPAVAVAAADLGPSDWVVGLGAGSTAMLYVGVGLSTLALPPEVRTGRGGIYVASAAVMGSAMLFVVDSATQMERPTYYRIQGALIGAAAIGAVAQFTVNESVLLTLNPDGLRVAGTF